MNLHHAEEHANHILWQKEHEKGVCMEMLAANRTIGAFCQAESREGGKKWKYLL